MSKNRRNGGPSGRRVIVCLAGMALGLAWLVPLGGCWWLPVWLDVLAYEQSLRQWEEESKSWPKVAVRIVNATDATATVSLTSAGIPPEGPSLFPVSVPPEVSYFVLDRSDLLIGPNGAVTGSFQCGEVIAIAVRAPFDLSATHVGYATYPDNLFGLYVEAGNCALSGVGTVGTRDFTGDTLALVRYVERVEDGLDCASGTLVITIERAGAPSVVDPATGELVRSARLGEANVAIE